MPRPREELRAERKAETEAWTGLVSRMTYRSRSVSLVNVTYHKRTDEARQRTMPRNRPGIRG